MFITKSLNSNEKIISFGNYAFLLGVFLLPSALPISGLFFLICILISYFKNKNISFKDKFNYPLFISIGLILFSCFNITLITKTELLSSYDTKLIWLNLFNWIPMFFFYWGFQFYLADSSQRLIFSKYLLAGTFPVILSFIFQKYLGWYGPFETFYGLIVWFQKPIYASGGFSGLFSNPNYAGIWLAISFPFSLFLLKNTKNNLNKKLLVLIFCISIPIMIYFTSSRNAFLGILIAFITLFGFTKFVFSIFLIVLTFLFSFLTSFLTNNQIILNNFLNLELVDKFLNIDYFSAPRIEIWQSALSRINERPLFGWGPSTFSYLHHEKNYHSLISEKIVEAYHSHNMIIELAHNFGIPLSIILASSISFLILKAWHKIFIKVKKEDESFLDKAWFSASLIVVFSHLIDVTYYDGKISILICILFAGLRCIINEKYNNVKFTYLKKS
tara:strand:+ start:143 stop:1474 length:1332 start_codon:yes stop_codon:yes gene_type:complete